MFDGFELQTDVAQVRQRLAAAAALAVGTLALLCGAAVALSDRAAPAPAPRRIEVQFRAPPPPPKPVVAPTPVPASPPAQPPPAPAKTATRKAPPPAAAAAPPSAAPLVAPREAPKTAAPESDIAVAELQTAVGGTGDGRGAGVVEARDEPESPSPAVTSAARSGPVNLPEDAEPPEPADDNAAPEYPEAARATGQQARVVLKIVVEADGRVGRVQVLKGEEPFVAAALSAVKTWHYAPATLEGSPLAVFKIVNITFSLRD